MPRNVKISQDGLQFFDDDVNKITLNAPTNLSSDIQLTLPATSVQLIGTPAAPTTDQYLKWDGTNWVSAAVSAPAAAVPIGTFSRRYIGSLSARTPTRASVDWLVSEGIGKWGITGSVGYLDATVYPDIAFNSFASVVFRSLVFRIGSTFVAQLDSSTTMQSTTDLTTLTNRQCAGRAVLGAVDSSWSDPVGGAWVGLWDNTWGYTYTTDGVTYNFGRYTGTTTTQGIQYTNTLINPLVVGGVYSFYDNQNARRYSTTDHITYTLCDAADVLGANASSANYHVVNGLVFLLVESSTTYYTSADNGITWTARTWPASLTIASPGNVVITHNGTVYLFSSGASASNTSIHTSPDLTTWTGRTCAFASAGTIARVGVANDIFFAFVTASVTKICTSADGITWAERTTAAAATYVGCLFVDSKYFVFSTGRVEGSANLATWALERASGPASYLSLNRTTRIVASTTRIAFTANPGTWTYYDSGAWGTVASTAQIYTAGSKTSAEIAGTLERWQA